MIHKIQFFLLVGALALVSGCVIQPVKVSSMNNPVPSSSSNQVGTVSGTSTSAAKGGIPGYKLRPQDPINIRFSGITDQQQPLNVVIDENGEINLLHIDHPVKAAGLTTTQLEDKIEHLYVDGGIYTTVSVNVTMTAKSYYVLGEVNAPGKFDLTSGTTLVQAVAEARGRTAFASDKVTITRQDKVYKYSWKDIQKHPSKDVKIDAGDVIKVWQSWY